MPGSPGSKFNAEVRSWTYLNSSNKTHGPIASRFEEKVLDNYINSVEQIEKICSKKSAVQDQNIVVKKGKFFQIISHEV